MCDGEGKGGGLQWPGPDLIVIKGKNENRGIKANSCHPVSLIGSEALSKCAAPPRPVPAGPSELSHIYTKCFHRVTVLGKKNQKTSSLFLAGFRQEQFLGQGICSSETQVCGFVQRNGETAILWKDVLLWNFQMFWTNPPNLTQLYLCSGMNQKLSR